MKQNLKVVNDEVEVQKKKASLKVISALQKTNLEIMAKTGIKIPIQKVKPENLTKIKRAAEISKMVSMAAQAAPHDGPETSNNNEIMNAESTNTSENTIFDKEGKEYAWDTIDNDYIETDESIDEEILIGEPTIPEMYAQNFMNAGGNGPVNV